MSHTPPDGGPDWTLIGGTLATLATVLGAIVAGFRGAMGRTRRDARLREATQSERDKNAIANTSLTLEGVFRLVNELQEEVTRRGQELIDNERRCSERMDGLLRRIADLEGRVEELKRGKAS